jgi:hypothetical protein
MNALSSKERLARTFRGEPIDRIPTFDILHNIALIEHLSGRKVTSHNAEDLLCAAAHRVLDLIRHFAVPDSLEPRLVRDGTGFTYQYEWWTGHLVERPKFDSTAEIEAAVQRDIELIYRAIAERKVCSVARQHVRLFDENYETFDQVKAEYRRITAKLEGTLMLPPEDVSPMGVAAERYDETGWWYFFTDYPETASRYMDALTDYQLAFIDHFADASLCPFTQISVPVGTTSSLLYSPEFFKGHVFPREKQKIDRWKKHGYCVMAFLDGYKWPVLDDVVALGIDEIHPCEPACRMDVRTMRDKYSELVIGQPIDCTQLLPFGAESDIRQAVIKAIEDAGGRKIMIGSTSEIHPEVNLRNAVVMYETARHYPCS